MAMIYDLLEGSLNKRNVRGLVPCCGQEGIKLKYRKTPQKYIKDLR